MSEKSQAIAGRYLWLQRTCAVISAVLVAAIAVLHANWALGGTWGIGAGIEGTVNATPSLPLNSRLATWGLVAFLFAAGALMWVRVGLLRICIPRWLIHAGCLFVAFFAFVMLGACIMDFHDPSPWTRFVYTPTALALLIATLIVMLPVRKNAQD